ncbi:MAG: hypothetical protein ABJD11_00195 [Gemmatimonadota bacterium]
MSSTKRFAVALALVLSGVVVSACSDTTAPRPNLDTTKCEQQGSNTRC